MLRAFVPTTLGERGFLGSFVVALEKRRTTTTTLLSCGVAAAGVWCLAKANMSSKNNTNDNAFTGEETATTQRGLKDLWAGAFDACPYVHATQVHLSAGVITAVGARAFAAPQPHDAAADQQGGAPA